MGAPKACPIRFDDPAAVRAEDPVTSAVWEGFEQRADLPKPGGGARVARVAKALLSPEESLDLLQAARSLGFVEGGSSSSAASVEVMEAGQYLGKSISSTLRPVVDGRLLPYVRWSLACPGAVVSRAAVLRHTPGDDREAPVRLAVDHGSFGTAVLVLNPEDARGGLFLQAAVAADSPGFVALDCGDLLLHQHDLPQGVRVQDGEWYCVVFSLKDSILACLTNTTPWYDALAEQGDADAQAALAFLQESGADERGPASAARWYAAAAEQGHPEAQERLGSLYMAGDCGLTTDASKAVHWWHEAALQGQRSAQRRLAEALLRGRGTGRNAAEAVRWLRRSSEQGDVEAIYLLVIACSTGTGGCSPDVQEALAWCKRGAHAGHPEMQHRLAVHLLTGDGLSQDLRQAGHWLERAAESGHPRAQCNLGVLLAQGLGGLPQSPTRARTCFERAAGSGDAEGQYNLALLLSRGCEDAPRDSKGALHWCRLAVAQGHSRAKSLLEDLERAGCQKAHEPREDAGEASSTRVNGTKLHSGLPPVVSLDASHRTRLSTLLSELQEMRKGAGGEPVEELIDVLQCLEGASKARGAGAPPRTEQAAAVAEPAAPGRAAPEEAAGERGAAEAGDRGAGAAAEGEGAAAVPMGRSERAPEPERAPARADSALPVKQQAAVPAQEQAEERPPPAPDQTCSSRLRHTIQRVRARSGAELQSAIAAGEPVLVADAMPHLSGKRVVEFMPKLINAAGKEPVTYEIQGPEGEFQLRQAPFALYVQGLQRSAPGRAFLMVSDRTLQHPELAEFLVPPSCFGPDRLAELPAELRPAEGAQLLVGGRGAVGPLHRTPVANCTWSHLVLGKVSWHLLPPRTELASLGRQEGAGDGNTSTADTFSEDIAEGGMGGPETEIWEATQEIGEALLLPPGWWCQARFEDRSLAVVGQQLPEASLASAAAQVARHFDLRSEPEWHTRSPWEVFEAGSEEARQRGSRPGDLGLPAALRSSTRPEPRSPLRPGAS